MFPAPRVPESEGSSPKWAVKDETIGFSPEAQEASTPAIDRVYTVELADESGTVHAFIEQGDRARISTWQIDVRRVDDDDWRIAGQERVSSVENIYRLTLNQTRQFDAKNFTILAEDLELTLVEGTVFTVDTDQGLAAVLRGRGVHGSARHLRAR